MSLLQLPDPLLDVLKSLSHDAHKISNAKALSGPQKELWLSFLIGVHSAGIQPQADDLKHWLVENGWQENTASEMVEDYGFSQRLLTRNQERNHGI